MVSVYPFSDQNGGKTLPDWGGGGTYLYGLYKGVPPGQRTFSNALHLFKKTANSVTYISPLRTRTHVEELLYRRKIWSDESKGKRLETLASNLPTIPYCFYRWISSKYTLVNLLALEKQHCNAGCVLGLDLLRERSDSEERCEVKKAMKSRRGLGRTRTPFYFAPLPTIWTPGTG